MQSEALYCYHPGLRQITAVMRNYKEGDKMTYNPNIDWYRNISNANMLPPRCQFSSIYRCPRNFQSIALISDSGLTTRLDLKTDRKLQKRWRKSEFWPKQKEEETSIAISGTVICSYNRFCPEVMYDNFGYFCDHLSYYRDDIDRDIVYKKLKKISTDKNDWRWKYSTLNIIHYSECKYYSYLLTYKKDNDELFELKPNIYGIGINLNTLFKRIFRHH